jgi:cation diffusion facilitator family transporter
VLALIALLIGWESFLRLTNPVAISFEQAIAVAVIGLVVNLICAWLLKDDHAHHGHSHGHGPDDHHHRHDYHHDEGHDVHDKHRVHDNNLRAAYLHVLADALTSILAIAALLLGRAYGWLWADPIMGVVGALVIARWSWGLIRDAGGVLLDMVPQDEDLQDNIRRAIETEGEHITDLHIWQVGPGHRAAIIALASATPKEPSHYKSRLAKIHGFSHVTIEVEPTRAVRSLQGNIGAGKSQGLRWIKSQVRSRRRQSHLRKSRFVRSMSASSRRAAASLRWSSLTVMSHLLRKGERRRPPSGYIKPAPARSHATLPLISFWLTPMWQFSEDGGAPNGR